MNILVIDSLYIVLSIFCHVLQQKRIHGAHLCLISHNLMRILFFTRQLCLCVLGDLLFCDWTSEFMISMRAICNMRLFNFLVKLECASRHLPTSETCISKEDNLYGNFFLQFHLMIASWLILLLLYFSSAA